MEVFRVLQPGPFTTVQDPGRVGYQQYGVPVAGSLDRFSGRVANLLVGNAEEAAVLEMTVSGVQVEVLSPAVVAVCGAEMPLFVNDQPRECWTAFAVGRGDVLTVKTARQGIRGYLAVSGGIDVPVVMGSRCTYVGAKLGGFHGRPLAKGDVLEAGATSGGTPERQVPTELRPAWSRNLCLRALPGPQDDHFDQGIDIFFSSRYRVSTQTDRMGCRLEGPPVPLREGVPKSIISEPSVPGGVQITPQGQPIILLVEQTVAGYVKIATVVSSDLDQVAQARPGDTITFEQVDLDQARQLYVEYQEKLKRVRALLA